MNKKIMIIGIIVVGIAFYGGVVYGKSTTPSIGQFANGQFSGNQNGARTMGMRNGVNGGFTAGEIISKDATSVTIKMQDGSTKIVFVSGSTQVIKSVSGGLTDLSTGTNVLVTGTTNSDGSITGQSVQIRPASTTPFMGGMRTQ